MYYHPEHYKQRFNIFRRVWQAPMNWVELNVLRKFLDKDRAHLWRFCIGRGFLVYAFAVGTAYYFKYRADDFTKAHNWRINHNRPLVLPGDPPLENPRTKPSDYASINFKDSPI